MNTFFAKIREKFYSAVERFLFSRQSVSINKNTLLLLRLDSIGDYVLSGGELAAAVVLDTIARLLPGVVGNADSTINESFEEGLLDCPQWTRPAEFRGWKAPEVLLGGNHAEIKKWRKQAAKAKTETNRPDLLT